MTDEFYYKLRDRKTGLFREGGMWAKWTTKGKRWSSPGMLKQHLNQFPVSKIDWDNWEIVEYQYQPIETSAKELKHFL